MTHQLTHPVPTTPPPPMAAAAAVVVAAEEAAAQEVAAVTMRVLRVAVAAVASLVPAVVRSLQLEWASAGHAA